MINPSSKLTKLPPYLFSQINQLKLEAYQKKLDVIDLGMGNPDLPTDQRIVQRLCETITYKPKTHRYPQAKGMPKFRKTISDWYRSRFGVKLDPENEVLALIGSKEGIVHLCMTLLEPGELTLVPDPAYPVYYNGTILAGGEVYTFPLLKKNGYLVDLREIPEKAARQAKIMFLNYPNNPTTAVIDDTTFLKEVIKFAKKYEILICYDNTYSEITFDGYTAPSLLSVNGAKDIAVEFHSLSKTFSMAGWRIGFVVGNEKVISMLEKFKSFTDYGIPTFIQLAGVEALSNSKLYIKTTISTYRKRRDIVVEGLKKLGWDVELPKATMYVWTRIPDKYLSMGSLEFSKRLLKSTGIVVAPGEGFGKNARDYVRFSLVVPESRLHDMFLRLRKFKI